MRIVVFGASGRTGMLFVKEALVDGHKVTAYVRNPESIKIGHANLKVVVGALNDKKQLKEIISGADACVSMLGGQSLSEHNFKVREGIDCIVSSMEEEGAQRLIYMSSIGAGESKYYLMQPMRWLVANVLLRVPLDDHNANEQRIMKSRLKWTIVRPGSLTNGPKTEKAKHGSQKIRMMGSGGISRANVAAFLLEQLAQKEYLNQCVWIRE